MTRVAPATSTTTLQPASEPGSAPAPPPAQRPDSAALGMVRTPPWIKRAVIVLLAVLLAAPFFLLLAPWQQTIRGSGRVVAFAPLDRQQSIESPISGRVVRMMVGEGTRLSKGDPVFEISDIDPQRISRLESQLQAERNKLESYDAQLEQYLQGASNVRVVGDLSIRANRARRDLASRGVEAAEAALEGARAEVELAERQLTRVRSLIGAGAVSQRQLEVAEADYQKALASVDEAEAKLEQSRSDLESAERMLERTSADANAKVNEAAAKAEQARTKVAESEQKIVDLQGQISRQRSQLVRAPRDGIVHRVNGYSDGDIVKSGDPIIVLIPEMSDRAVEIWVDGNDAPLVSAGDKVRLQFEGWPAVQFVGWPSVAVGTFGGKVSLVDPTDDGQGRFRLLVVPDPEDEQGDWPSTRYLRQGVRAKGWVLLNEVSVGWELWRQLNGFPPVVAQDPPDGVARKRIK